MDVMSLIATLGIDITQFEAGLNQAKTSVKEFVNEFGGSGSGGTSTPSFQSAFGGLMKGASRAVTVGIAGLTAAGTMFVKSAVQTGLEFDKGISQIAATLGLESSSEIVQNLREYAIDTGETTVFTATEAAEALNYMALAGYDAEKSMRVLPDVLNLAAAGALDLGYASDVVTDLGTALGLTEGQVTTMTDQMAKAASTTNTNVGQLAEAMLRLGANGRTVKGGTKEIAAVFGVLADNGLKGAEAGTHLRNILLKLANPSEGAFDTFEEMGREIPSLFDEDGGMKDLPGYFQDLKGAIGDLSDEEILSAFGDLFNDRDIAAARALMETDPERWTEIFEKLGESAGAAGEMAHEQLNNLAGDLKLFDSAWQTMQIRVSDALSPLLRNVTAKATEGVKKLTENIEEFLGSEKGVAVMEKMSGAFDTLIDKLTSTENIEAIFNLITKAVEGLASAIEFIANNSDAIVATFQGIGTALGVLFVGDKATKTINTLSTIGKFFGFGGGASSGGAADAGGAGTGSGGGILKSLGGMLGGAAKAAGAVLSGPVGGVLALGGASFAGFAGMDAYATNRDYGDLNSGLAHMQERIAALESKDDEKSAAYADAISSLGGLLDTLNEGDKNTFEGEEWNQLSAAVESAKALMSDGSEESEAKFAEIQTLIDEMINNPNAGANEQLISSLGTLLSDLETQSQEQAAQMTEDVNNAATASLEDLETTAAHTIEVIGTDMGSSIESGVSSGAASMSSTLASEGAAAAESIASAIQSALNNVHLPTFSLPTFGSKTQKNARAMNTGRIFNRPTIFGYADGAYQVAGDAGPEAVVGVSSLRDMIRDAVGDQLGAIINGMGALQAGQNQGDLQMVLDSGVLVGQIARGMDKQMGKLATWRGGGRA